MAQKGKIGPHQKYAELISGKDIFKDRRLQHRIGVDIGDVVEDGNWIYGSGDFNLSGIGRPSLISKIMGIEI